MLEVVTWPRLLVVGAAHAQQGAHASTTSLLCAQQLARLGHCVRSVHATWVLGVRTVHITLFCDNALFRVIVWITVHGHYSQGFKKKKEYKIFLKIFLCKI